MKQIRFQMKPNKDKKFKAEMLKDGDLIRTVYLTSDRLQEYLKEKLETKSLIMLRETVKLFKTKEIVVTLKEDK